MDINIENTLKWSTTVGGVLITSFIVYKTWKGIKSKYKRKDYPADTVILHQLGRGPYAPSLTPFAVKLETYLRMAKIPYQNALDFVVSKKNKVPWIEYNGDSIDDSQFCVEYLNKKLSIDLNENFTAKDTAVARAFQKMLEENTYWVLAMDRWVYDTDWTAMKMMKIPYLLAYMFRRKVKQMAYAQGMGRHSQDEVFHIFNLDLKALSDFLDNKKFLLGDSPCLEDCSVFGMLSQPYWHSFGSRVETDLTKYKNLCDYCDRMKETFWPDWNDCTTRGWTQEATK